MILIITMLAVLTAGIYFVKAIYPDKFTWQEFFLTIIILSAVLFIGYAAAIHSKTYDQQILSGKVLDKSRDVVSCRHSYPCHCRDVCSGYGQSRSCNMECDTCYEHSYDIDWDVKTTIGMFTIETIDSQGLKQPPRWSIIKANDPVSRKDSFENFIKAVPDSLYHRITNETVPQYPLTIYDYYHINRVVDFDLKIPEQDFKKLNDEISLQLRDVAQAKQVNLVIVLVDSNKHGLMFAQDLKAAWLGGKKNDVVVVIGSSEYPKIDWADVFSWSQNDMINVSLRDAIIDHGKIDDGIVTIAVDNINKYFSRKHMSEYSYLKEEITPSLLGYCVIFFFGLLSAAAAVTLSMKYESEQKGDWS